MTRSFLVGAALLFSASALAQTGVSADRVSLPDGPGSLGGVGENVGINANMGLLSYAIPIEVPEGYKDLAPSLALTYSSGSGSSVAGIGWSVGGSFIERMTARGVPRYELADRFAVDGSEELVELPGTTPPTYRARREGSFVRWRWHERDTGANGYWTAEYPDGRVGYFGADATGSAVASARDAGPAGTFRYHLVEMVDPFGHSMRYFYNAFDGAKALLERVAYVADGASWRFAVKFLYESRQDLISDAKPGFEDVLRYRLAAVEVYSGTERLRRYLLEYEDYAASGGLTRLVKVRQRGVGDAINPVVFSFSYSQSLGGTCTGSGACQEPYLAEMGSIGMSMASRQAALIDLNGDALPDIVSAMPGEQYQRIYLNQLAADGTHRFAPFAESTVALVSAFTLGSKRVQTLDVDGDGFADLINGQTGQALLNKGGGDWDQIVTVGAGPDLEGLDVDEVAGGNDTLRFLDYDNDRQIDILQTLPGSPGQTHLYRNVAGTGFVQVSGVENIGWNFQEQELDLADMNGDGLLDPVIVLDGALSYRLNLGNGTWGPIKDITGLPFTGAEKTLVQLEDLNGDGLSDLVVVTSGAVKYALNRNGDAFEAPRTVTEAKGGQALPELTDRTVLFADMNGNGSDDVVWVDTSGAVTYLELFPVRPNLITRIENGMGMVTEVSYTTSVEQSVRDAAAGQPWPHRLPHPMAVVEKTDTWEERGALHNVVGYAYHEGFYDGVEKQFRGFGRVLHSVEEDESQEAGGFLETFDLGLGDACRAGLPLTYEVSSAGRAILATTNTWDLCEVAEVPATGLAYPVRFPCRTREVTVIKEGRPEAEWLTTEERSEYDGYGNVVLATNLGVTARGGGACAACPDDGLFGEACGADCLGDEAYVETRYVPPTAAMGGWDLRNAHTVKSYGTPGRAQYAEVRNYYDGPDFEGLPLGQATKGLLTRRSERVDAASDGFVDTVRMRFDAHGNPVEVLDALGAAGSPGHRSALAYDELSLRVVRKDQYVGDPAYFLRTEYRWDPVHAEMVEATDAMRVEGGAPVTSRNSTVVAYDALGRQASLVSPGGDTVASPTEAYTYEIGNPVSRVVVQRRSKVGAAFDLEEVRCFDGLGRLFEKRHKLADGRWLVTGHSLFNKQGTAVRSYQQFEAPDGACSTASPENGRFLARRYDALQRLIEEVEPDAEERAGQASRRTFEYWPQTSRRFDELAADPSSPEAGTPVVTVTNGLDKAVRVERRLGASAAPEVYTLRYDEHGHLARVVDPEGNVLRQSHDLLGRTLRTESPDRGTTTYEYDAQGNLVRRADARGVAVAYRHDGLNRLVSVYDEKDEAGTAVTSAYDQAGACPATRCAFVAGRLAQVSYPAGGVLSSDWLGYDARGHLAYQGRTLSGQLFERQATYDNLGRLVSKSYPQGRSLTLQYDAASRLSAIPGFLQEVGYDSRGLVDRLLYANGVETQRTHDARGRLLSARSAVGGSALLERAYTVDRKGRVLAVADALSAAAKPSGKAAYAYDAHDRLLQAALDEGGSVAETLSLSFDALDNIRSQASSLAGSVANLGSYTVGGSAGPHAVTGAGGRSFGYDAAGYMTTHDADACTWDHLGRLTRVERGGEELARFEYGSAGRVLRVEGDRITYYPFEDYAVRDGVSEVQVEGPLGLVALARAADVGALLLPDVAPASLESGTAFPAPDGEITAADAWMVYAGRAGIVSLAASPGQAQTGSLLWASVRRLLAAAEPTVWANLDAERTTLALTGAQGALVGTALYYPFGERRAAEGLPAELVRFTGKELDESTGLIYFGARYYEPRLGRWMSPDPAFEILANGADPFETTSAYAYAGNDPIGTIDPDGLAPSNGRESKKGKVEKKQTEAKKKLTPAQKKRHALKHKIHKATAKLEAAKAKSDEVFAKRGKWARGDTEGMVNWARDAGNANADVLDARQEVAKLYRQVAGTYKEGSSGNAKFDALAEGIDPYNRAYFARQAEVDAMGATPAPESDNNQVLPRGAIYFANKPMSSAQAAQLAPNASAPQAKPSGGGNYAQVFVGMFNHQ